MSDVDGRVARIGRLLFALTLTVYLTTAGGSLTTTDAVATFDVTRSIVERGSIAMSGNILGREAERGRDGRYYSPFGIGQSVYNIPFYVAASVFARATGVTIGKPDSLAKAAVALGETFLVAAIVHQSFYLAVAVTGDVVCAALAALTLGVASILWPYSRFGFNQPLTCLALLVATRHVFAAARRGSLRHAVYAGFWVAAALMTRHESGLAAVPLAGWLWFDGRPTLRERMRRVAALAPGVLAGVATWLLYNAVRFGNPIDSGYLRDTAPAFGSPLIAGLIAVLASPSASIFLYSPVAAGGLVGLVYLYFKRDRSAAVLLLAMILVFVIFYANLGNWLGGRSYGSRYLVIVLPYLGVGWAAALSALSRRPRQIVWGVVGVVGCVVQWPGVFVDYAKVSQAVGTIQSPFSTEERQWRWEASPIVLNTRALVHAVPDNVDYLLGRRQPPPIAPSAREEDRTFSQQFSFSLDLWWLYLYYLHVLSRAGVALVIAALGALTVFLSTRTWRELRHTESARPEHAGRVVI